LRVGPTEVNVVPKVTIDRVLFLLSSSPRGVTWHDPRVSVSHAPDLLAAVAGAYVRLAEQALLRGLLQGYRTVEASLPVVRGRIREAVQLRRRYGLMMPAEVRFDDFTVDTPENRLLRAAGLRLLRVPGVPAAVRHRLRRLDLLLADVTPLASGVVAEPWRPTRLNARYHDALRLAEVIVRAASFEQSGSGLQVSGFVIDMARVFEDFVCRSLGAALVAVGGGRVATQDRRWALDAAGEVALRPDLVWDWPSGLPRAVIDAKYKAERPSGFPYADLYQLLAYCTALGLAEGHLVYARGNEAGRVHQVVGTNVTLRAHALDLAQEPAALVQQVGTLATAIAATAPLESERLTI
jgi:5-methylcytosine-specific restriction enzyme subunit McrC